MQRRFREFYKSYLSFSYNVANKNNALRILKDVESVKGKTDKKLLKSCDDYAGDVLGWKGYAPWLYMYTAVSGAFQEGWIPDNYYGKVVVPALKGNYGAVGDYNALTSRLLDSSLFPDLGYYTNGLWLLPDYTVLSEKQFIRHLREQCEKVVFKLDSSKQGRGIYFFDSSAINGEEIKKLGNGVFQSYIQQHDFFNEIMENSVATIRLTSVTSDTGEVSVRSCFLRVGRREDTHIHTTSNIKLPVDLADGKLGKFGFSPRWLEIEKHPDTGFVFENQYIPNFHSMVSTVMELHRKVPFVRIIGWDLTVDQSGQPQVMEWNGGHNGIYFTEAVQGPGFIGLGLEELWKK
ncbi:hypothetical protein A3SI_18999 [Nitritalea halalkaliphila LW7]|uniref:Alpha-L-glutamate ligase-related protein ATP-grasp domain-containing protein n=1 Tax=Nitritalea halalkaliphila LW7 TaxID=1189621 RepID=I5BTL8_9BACT|nr:sugar-transfer associated ATP-grasp domain-containing protein [Nitritalea halalkaliphila]EIM72920.1 hypothetical protein A3SI_18999 [Nitritalea halalkaliphila LW7]